MYSLKKLKLFSFFVLSCLSISEVKADGIQDIVAKCQTTSLSSCCNSTPSNFGTSTFSVTDPGLWYTIETNSYPITTPLSESRNRGVAKGNVFLSPTGFTIGETGNYWISITAVLQNPAVDPVLVPVFLVFDETFNPDDPALIGAVVTLDSNQIDTVHGTGTVKNISAGTRISLVATNGGNPTPQPVTVVSWSISLFQLP